MYSNKAKEASIEWSKKGKEAVDRWKKERYDAHISFCRFVQQPIEKQVFGMQLKEAVALTKIEDDDLVSNPRK
ncbi:hypothetical protein RO3G_09647 [Rhizopus delemar RA 99-880]|uniref:Uncharacterized protein n=1 Tax=Rhizopus delemar (strain RA 99-880 / ATCC MYA-4621 / FGSC 9543 / NRRL 43880) TaxID=246409 RepID=I1C907_RHIO9|nr:hypothetical protein RO3G_09647 [Rhizopus delemar RA 99-880]|eukprot:EIE84937.1 hypothetical protein RO3G_09647 [Rhizopus delemar RA 99-880]